jgi:predicted Zn-dependent protease
MTPLDRRAFLRGGACCTALTLAGCADPVPDGEIAAGYRPSLATDEGGLWQEMDRAEAAVKRSPERLRDPALNAYVSGIVCRLAGPHCVDIRTYILRTPFFNASMAPNGMMQVWTGLLLRTQNEAQLAAILGHEIGHYLERDSLRHWRKMRDASGLSTVLGIGFGGFAAPAQLLAVASVSSFSRDQERRADGIGLELMAKAGYDPSEAARIWQQLIDEEAAAKDKSERSILFADHPTDEERLASLRAKAKARGGAPGAAFAARYQQAIAPIRPMLLEDELKLRQYGRTLVVLQHLTATIGDDGELAYIEGEVYRLRDGKGDRERARAAFDRAIAHGDCPPETYRSLGLVALRSGDRKAADGAFDRYLALRPNATDRSMILSYMQSKG